MGTKWLLPKVVVFSGTSSWSVHFQCLSLVFMMLLMPSYVAMFSNFDGICVSDNRRLGLSAGDGGLNYQDVDGNGVPDIGISS